VTAALYSGGPCANDFEAVVAAACQSGLPDDAVVIANVWIGQRDGHRAEIDVIVLNGDRLTLCEVKSWRVAAGSTDGARWTIPRAPSRPNPYRTIESRARQMIRTGPLRRLQVDHLLVMPSPDTITGPAASRERVVSVADAVRRLDRTRGDEVTPQVRMGIVEELVGPRPPIPETLGSYGALRLEGGGPGYRSFHAVDTVDGTPVYLKVIDAQLRVLPAQERKRLVTLWRRDLEVRRRLGDIRGLLSPIPQPADPSQMQDQLFVAYNWAHDTTLRRLVSDGQTGHAKALDLLAATAQIVEAVNNRDVQLRHVNPETILVTGDRVLVTGLEWARHGEMATGFPGLVGNADGSPYIAPEVRSNHAHGWPRADVYSLAAVAGFVLIGEDPPSKDHDRTIETWLTDGELPVPVTAVLRRGLVQERRNARRQHSPVELIDELREALLG